MSCQEYNIGDVLTDKQGNRILVKKFTYGYRFDGVPFLAYNGVILKKDGTPKKNGDTLTMHRSNIVTPPTVKNTNKEEDLV